MAAIHPEQPLHPVQTVSLAWRLVHLRQPLVERQNLEVQEGAAQEQSRQLVLDVEGDSSHAGRTSTYANKSTESTGAMILAATTWSDLRTQSTCTGYLS